MFHSMRSVRFPTFMITLIKWASNLFKRIGSIQIFMDYVRYHTDKKRHQIIITGMLSKKRVCDALHHYKR